MKIFVKCFLTIACVLASSSFVFAQNAQKKMPRSEWLTKIGPATEDMSLLRETMSKMDPADQPAFLQKLNEAVDKKGASAEKKTAMYAKIANTSFSAASKDMKLDVLAEVYATVPPESLTVVNETLAKSFDKKANGLSDRGFKKIATAATKKTVERTQGMPDGDVRAAFGILTFMRASGGSPADLRDTLLSEMSPDARNRADTQWLDPASKEGNYDPMLGSAGSDEPPVRHTAVVALIGQSLVDALLADMAAQDNENTKVPVSEMAGGAFNSAGDDAFMAYPDSGALRVPRLDPKVIEALEHPRGYQNQTK